jgi:hypothetical protein
MPNGMGRETSIRCPDGCLALGPVVAVWESSLRHGGRPVGSLWFIRSLHRFTEQQIGPAAKKNVVSP